MAETWQMRLAGIPWAIARQQFNLLGSHDTVRLRTILQKNDALHRLAALLQFTFPGVPCLYYGDEIGLTEDEHLRSRNCMVWDETRWDHDLLAFYQNLIALRKESTALQRGGFQILLTEPDTLAYQRDSLTERIIVVAHRAEAPRPAQPLPVTHGGIADGAQFTEHFTGQTLTVENGMLPLPKQPQGATLWHQRGSAK
jgi:alpha-glucosidase